MGFEWVDHTLTNSPPMHNCDYTTRKLLNTLQPLPRTMWRHAGDLEMDKEPLPGVLIVTLCRSSLWFFWCMPQFWMVVSSNNPVIMFPYSSSSFIYSLKWQYYAWSTNEQASLLYQPFIRFISLFFFYVFRKKKSL